MPDALRGTLSGDGRSGTSGPSAFFALGSSRVASFSAAGPEAAADAVGVVAALGDGEAGAAGAEAGGAASSGRGREGPLEPLEVTTRFGGAGGGDCGRGAVPAAGTGGVGAAGA